VIHPSASASALLHHVRTGRARSRAELVALTGASRNTVSARVDQLIAAGLLEESGEAAASNLLQAAPQIDALWNHDDDQGVGVLAAINNAGRNEFIMVGGAGSANAMRAIQADDSVLKATVIYPSTRAADGVRLARLLGQDKSLSDLVEVEIPRQIVLNAPVVTKDNVDQYIGSAFES
jgi:ribose transport system substrate-binding protein